ncbi:serine/threonine protein kinase, putative [Heliomicrobium modesticaldum Ice1]|uniref:non-specific serine/threonine protein kinase n=1 Tax=Heliobacterium modesticaldum (strain ATCC 51547 / Ice1) TaxID=498761 RepID=B0TCF7_HELMI|nr:protein kinase [Heliomicrobium modesticaldum]ABZ85345.1 serine/threonine protein kinase, putative [Heliomicrobium modesticaldum Ice1]
MLTEGQKVYLKLLLSTGRYGAAAKTLTPGEGPEEGKLALALAVLAGDYIAYYKAADRWDETFGLPAGADLGRGGRFDASWLLLRCHGELGYRGLHPRSLPIFLTAARHLPQDPFAIWAAAVGCADRNQFDAEAISLYERALSISGELLAEYDPGDLLSQDPLFNAYPRLLTDLRRVLGADLWAAGRFPPEWELQQLWEDRLVNARLRKDDPEEEDVAWLRRYLHRSGDYNAEVKARIQRFLGRWVLRKRDPDESQLALLEESVRYLSLREKLEAERTLGQTYFARRSWGKAVFWLQRSTLRQKTDLRLQMQLAQALTAWQHEQPTSSGYRKVRFEARKAWRRVLEVDPLNGKAFLALGEMDEEEGAFAEARDDYARALAAGENVSDDGVAGLALAKLGVLCFRGGQLDEAEQLLTRAASRIVPDRDENRTHLARALYYLGEVYRRQEELFRAESFQRQALIWDPMAGDHFRGDWERLLKLGEGGFAEVWKVRHRRTGQLGAMKMLKANLLGREKARKRFKNEAILTMNLGGVHNLIQGFPDSVDFTRFSFVVELLDSSLKKRIYRYDDDGRIAERRPLAESELLRLIQAVGDALVYIHSLGPEYIHRDIKPDNILITEDFGKIRLADLGTLRISRELYNEAECFQKTNFPAGSAGEPAASKPKKFSFKAPVRENTVFADKLPRNPGFTPIETLGNLGTPPYTAPEVIRCQNGWGDSRHDQRADLFSFGATLFEAATGYPPFTTGDDSEENIHALMDRVINTAFQRPEELGLSLEAAGDLSRLRELHRSGQVAVTPRGLNPSLPEKWETVILRCLEKDPERRYPAVRFLLEDMGIARR